MEDKFSLRVWLKSVHGRTVTLEPDVDQREPLDCPTCEVEVLPIITNADPAGKCPLCGYRPSLSELGTSD